MGRTGELTGYLAHAWQRKESGKKSEDFGEWPYDARATASTPSHGARSSKPRFAHVLAQSNQASSELLPSDLTGQYMYAPIASDAATTRPSPAPLSEQEIQDQEWVDQNIGALAAEYPNMWIAVSNKRVIQADEDLDCLISSISKALPKEHPAYYLMTFNQTYAG